MQKISKVKPLSNYKLWVQFTDGVAGEVDLNHLNGKGVFRKWDDYEFFKAVKISESGELYWDDRIDLCPDSIYMKITDKSPKELFPSLNEEIVDA